LHTRSGEHLIQCRACAGFFCLRRRLCATTTRATTKAASTAATALRHLLTIGSK
jgi:hypothetical protein